MIGFDFDPAASRGDLVLPFQLEASDLRGRLVRLGPALDAILARHDYPPAVNLLLAETIAVAVTLASLLKYEGVFTLQARGDGPVSTLVVDVTSAGAIRAYAQIDAARLPPEAEGRAALLGGGHLAFTVDQGDDTERYQGIVELAGETMADAMRHYFRQSEQLDTGVKLAVRHHNSGWQAGAVLLQRLPEDQAKANRLGTAVEDGWRRGMVLLGTASDDELADPALAPEDLLFRLFHEERVRVFPLRGVADSCRCSAERLEAVMRSFPADEVAAMADADGTLEAKCEFCGEVYRLRLPGEAA